MVKLVGANQDVSARHTAASALRDSEEQLRQLAENLREVVWMKSIDTAKMLYISSAYATIWGRSCASLYAGPQT